MLFKAFCALADGAVSPIDSSLKYFREEYEEHVRLGRCPLKDALGEARPTDRSLDLAQVFGSPSELALGEVLG